MLAWYQNRDKDKPLKSLVQTTGRLLFVAYLAVLNSAFANEALPGGEATVFQTGSQAFSLPSANLPMMKRLDFSAGNSFFRNPWVIAPASTAARDGLGPLFNTNTCQSCHIKDGRGHPPSGPDDSAVSMLFRLSVPPNDINQEKAFRINGFVPEPTYGSQFQDKSVPGVEAEGRVQVTWKQKKVSFADGTIVWLRDPEWKLTELNYGAMDPNVMISPRVAPPMIGLGLLEAIPADTIYAQQDLYDENSDGISGKANQVWDKTLQDTTLGRFGWKAGQPSLKQQNAAAFNGDLGLTSTLFPLDHCTGRQHACANAADGGKYEVSDKILSFVEFYAKNVGVPARTKATDPQVLAGKKQFMNIGCDGCHTPKFVTAKLPDQPALSEQEIYPYTDLLLHDMGEELADNRPEFKATGSEWRTPPLWGLSQMEAVSGHTQLLHDGRARNVMEAILWHGGEAKRVRQVFLRLEKTDRDALIAFVESL